MRKVAGKLRLDLAQYRELVTFLQFGSELDKATQDQITRGERVVEILKQGQYQPLSLGEQIMIIYSGVNGLLDDLTVEQVRVFESGFFKFVKQSYPAIETEIQTTGDLTNETADTLKAAVMAYKAELLKK
jgi:F-type H+-transporting ATPase subunit alpha